MLAPVALLIAAAFLPAARAHANNTVFTTDVIDRALSAVFGDAEITKWPHGRILECAQNAGPATCLRAFSAWRADHALNSIEKFGQARSSFDDDLRTFPWEMYTNVSEEAMEEKLCDSTSRLLQRRSLTLTALPGYRFELESKDGELKVDIYKSQEEARGTMKKLRKRFLRLLPLMLIPGLIMSAILPFFLPAVKMATIGAGMLNQMALTGAIFTLLRNNAFNDKYEKKIIYVNAGYKNEKRRPIKVQEGDIIHTHTIENENYFYEPTQDVYEYAASDNFERAEQPPENSEWLTNFYGNVGSDFTPATGLKQRRDKFSKKKPIEVPVLEEFYHH